MKKDSSAFIEYNRLVHKERVRFMQSPGIQFYMCELDRKRLHAFLIVWSHFSIKMTEQVEDWIARAGARSAELGFQGIGKKLKVHSAQEAEHDLMLVDDLKVLLGRWNQAYGSNLEASVLDTLTAPENTAAYVKIHEDTIAGAHPYGQVAIEYEIERISVGYGPHMVENVLNTLGADFESGIGFLAHHVLLDQGHTKFNKVLLEECLAAGGEVGILAATGASALRIYGDFLTECVNASAKLIEMDKQGEWKSHFAT